MTRRAKAPRERGRRQSASVSIDEALALAIALHRDGQLEGALEIYQRVLQAQPEHPDALHFRGVLSHQTGKSVEAVTLIRKALAVNPDHPDAWNNLGNILKEQGHLDEAIAAYRRAIELHPGHADAYNNLGTVLSAHGHLDEAIAAYKHAIALQQEHADAYLNLGNVYKKQDRVDDTIQAYLKTISLRRYHPDAYRNLGNALYAEGRIAEAKEVYETWLRYQPEHPVALHMLAACSGENVPGRASDDYVQAVFNRFAASFDKLLVERLDYRAPALVAAVVAEHAGAPAAQCVVLDAGCGTGLCGPLLRPYARRLVGVDLSPGMLEKAQARQVYDDLARAELTEYLSGCLATFDLIASADVLVYFGDLTPVFTAAASALRPGGRLIFTVEHARDDPGASFRINPHGRYSHSEAYLRRILATARLTVCSITEATLRTEKRAPVAGLVACAQK